MRNLRPMLVCLVLAAPAGAQDATQTPWTQQVIESAKLGESRTVYVATPADYGIGARRYPVLVLLDGNDRPQAAAALANAAFLSSRGEIPPLIVVAISNGKDRTHDLTPRALGATAKGSPTAGGAETFLSFITDEVLPEVRSKYRTMPSTVLAGHSFGGLFALHAAAAKPGTFNGIIAMSPSLWWNDSAAAVAYADSIASSPGTLRLFATSGGREPTIDVTTRRFAARLDSIKPPALAFAHQRYPSDTHGLTPLPSLIDGLRFVFEPLSLANAPVLAVRTPDSAAVVNAVFATQRRYARAARELGMPESLPASFVNGIGYTVLRELKLPGVAVWLFRQNADNYPDSPSVYNSLGDGLLAVGDRRGARAEFQRAVDIAARTNQPVDTATRRKLAELERSLESGRRNPR